MSGPENGHPAREHVEDPALHEVAERVHRAMHLPQSREAPTMRADRRAELRAELVAARAEVIATGQERAPSVRPAVRPLVTRHTRSAAGWRRPAIAWVGAALAAAVLAVAVLVHGLTGPSPVNVTAVGGLLGSPSANPASPLRLRFSQALDPVATQAALHLSPAASMRWSWQGDTLTGSPVNGFAPNSAYLLTVDRNVARTAAGAPLAADLHVPFGTAPTVAGGPTPPPAVPLPRTVLAAADDDSEAVVTRDGAALLTSAKASPGSGYRTGLVKLNDGTARRLAQSADGICASRSGDSIAYLLPSGSGREIVFADGAGIPTGRVRVDVDQDSPLGWIDDAEVSYVDAGRLRAVNRSGQVRTLSGVPVDAGRDRIVISPGGRYVFLAEGSSPGRLIDLHTAAAHPLPGISGEPTFSSDGATVVWIDGRHRTPRVATAPSGGGPVLTVPLPIRPGDRLSDLAVSPDGSQFVYSLTRADNTSQLRLASLSRGNTLAVSTAGGGQSPNWSASGRWFTVLGHRGLSAQIETVAVPDSTLDRQAHLEASVSRFASAQLSGDLAAQRALTPPGTRLPSLPPFTRAAVLWVLPGHPGTARVRLTVDPQPGHPARLQAEETLTIGQPSGEAGAPIRAVSIGAFRPAPAGPQLQSLDTDSAPGAVVLTFDSDLDPASVAQAAKLTAPGGSAIAATVRYDSAARTLTLTPRSGSSQPLVVRIGTGLRDVSGTELATAIKITIDG
jgi:hypothetical protein